VTYVDAMGWTLTHFLWEGAAIALAYALADALLRRASSHVRYGLAASAMGAMAAAVAGTFVWLMAGDETGSGGTVMVATILATGVHAARSHAPAASADYMPYVVMAWMAGVALLTVRLGLQWRMVERCRRYGVQAVEGEWEERVRRVAMRLGVGRIVPLCESAIADVPAVVGWLRPVILVPAGVLMNLTPEQVEAIVAHELAHVRRNDYLMNLLQTAVETVLFYHPAVWWVSRRVRQERENCCDDLAVEVCGNATAYARALAELEHLRGVLPGLAMAANRGSLLERIERLVAPRQDGRAKPAAGVGALCLMAAAIALMAAPRLLPSGGSGLASVGFGLDSAAASDGGVQAEKAPLAPTAAGTTANKESYLDSLERAGYHNLSVDEMIAMKIHGVSAEQVKEMAALGFTLSPDDAVAARIHDVTPAFVKACKAQGLGDLSFDQLVAMKIHGVDGVYISQFKALGLSLNADDAVSFRIHNVTPASLKEAQAMGFKVSADDAVSMAIHHVDAAFVKAWKDTGLSGLDVDELVSLSIHGAEPSDVKELTALGFKDLSADDIVGMRIHGVTAAFIKDLQKRGFQNLTLDQAMEIKRSGVLDPVKP